MLDSRIFSKRLAGRRKSIIRELEPLSRLPGVISLGAGYPSPATFPLREARFDIDGIAIELSAEDRQRACQYGPTEGDPALVQRLHAWHAAKSGVSLEAGQLLVLSGSQEGLFSIACLVLDPGDAVLLAEPAYPGALSSFTLFTEELVGVAQDERGMRPDALRDALAACRAPAKMLYLNPTCQNPAGVTMDEERRRALLAIAAQHGLLVVEDDAYELLGFDDGPRPPTLQALDPANVLRLDSFSKVLAPGLRLGYASGPRWLVDELRLLRQSSTIQSSSLDQVLLEKVLEVLGTDGLMQRVARSRAHYRKACDTVREALARHLPSARYVRPAGGFFLWLEVDGVDTAAMIRGLAGVAGVLMMPGAGFAVRGNLDHALRIAFSLQTNEALAEGIRRLKEMISLRLIKS